jgi:hypothetical protein
MRSKCPVHEVRLADGHHAWLVVGHDAARQALRDTRFSKDFLAALDEDPEVVDAGLPGPAFARHMLAVDGEDHLYVVDARFEAVQIFDAEGTLLLTFGEEGHAPGQFWLPNGIFIDHNNRLWVADSYNRRVQVFDYRPGGAP